MNKGSWLLVGRRPAPRHGRPPKRRRLAWAAGITLLACGLLVTALGIGGLAFADRTPEHRQAGQIARVPVPRGRLAPLPGSSRQVRVARPVRLVIPAIGVSTQLVRLGLTSAHTLQVPESTAVAGWYTGSPRPGAIGSAVIAGHIDSRLGPAVFFRLRQLRRGERVYVVRADRTVAVFKIISIHLYRKDRFPAHTVYGPTPDAELRLITCGGLFDYATGSYLSNVVVYAVLVR